MKKSMLENKLRTQIEDSILHVTPGLQVQVFQTGRKVIDLAAGKTFPYYDLASLTKILFTVPALMDLYEANPVLFSQPAASFLKDFPSESLFLSDLLSHRSGLQNWSPLYQKIDLTKSVPERWEQVRALLKTFNPDPTRAGTYSDLNFLWLSLFLMQMRQKSLADIFLDVQQKYFPSLSTLHFNVENSLKFSENLYAPTERCVFRNRLLRGEVHDENAWALGGASTHAGLFGSIDDVSSAGLFIRSEYLGFANRRFRMQTVNQFMKRDPRHPNEEFAWGFMTPTPGSSSSGNYLSPEAIGHTGFTGTSLWFDPHMDLLIVILSNRVYFGRENLGFVKLRPKIHDWVIEGLRRL